MTDFPKTIILPDEAEDKRRELRSTVQRVQAAYLSLKEDNDFVLPDDWRKLSAEYSKNYYAPFLSSIDRDITIDDLTRKKLRNKWDRIQAKTTSKINVIVNGISSTPQLRWEWDDKVMLPVPAAPIDEVADQMATAEIDPTAAQHWALLNDVVSAYKTLREFEDENRIGKKPLNWLFPLSKKRFAEEWASGNFLMAEAPDQTTAERWRIMQKSIF